MGFSIFNHTKLRNQKEKGRKGGKGRGHVGGMHVSRLGRGGLAARENKIRIKNRVSIKKKSAFYT